MTKNPWDHVTAWHELMSLDPKRAKKFYEEVIGLTAVPLEGVPFPYTLWLQDGEPVGGLVPPQGKKKSWPSGRKPHWVSSFAIADVDDAVKKAQKRGGEVLVPPPIYPNLVERQC